MRWLVLLVLGGCFTELGIGANRTFAPWQKQEGWGAMVSVSQGFDMSKEPRKRRTLVGSSCDILTSPTALAMSLGLLVGGDLDSVAFRIALAIAPDMMFADEEAGRTAHAGAYGIPAFVGKRWAIGDNGSVTLGSSLVWFRGHDEGETLFSVGPMVRVSAKQGLLEAWGAVPRGGD